MSSTHFILCTLGTRGDIAPFAALARDLVSRGQQVTVLSNCHWRELVEACGAHFVPIAPEDPPQSGRDDFAFFLTSVLPSFRISYDIISAAKAADPQVVVVYKMGMLGAQCAAEKFGLINVKVALQPSAIRSCQRPVWPLTRLVQGPCSYLTRTLVRALYFARELASRYRPHTNRFRRSLELSPVMPGMVNRTEDLTLVMCPSWFAMPQADWPSPLHCVGFPFAEPEPLDRDVVSFIESRGAPLVFTPGTGVTDTRRFFEVSREVCNSMRIPGLFLSPHASRDFESASIMCRGFSDLGSLLPHARLLVHHGGIGTTAQALRAGIPQMILPGRFDQPDNAMRVATLRLGAAALSPEPRLDDWSHLIRVACQDETLRQRLAVASQDIRRSNAAAHAATLIQRLACRRQDASLSLASSGSSESALT